MDTLDRSSLTFFMYARKSTEAEDRQMLSIDSQISELKILTQRDRLSLKEIRQEAHSAKAPGRPIFNTMLDDIESGKANALIVWNPDRLSRNSVDTGRIIYLFDIGKLTEVVTPSQVFRNTPNDKFLLSMLCSQAKLENDNKSINVKRGLRAKCERGIFPAPAPVGYINDKYAERGNKTLLPDPERFELVKQMLKLVISQKYTPMQVYKKVTTEWKLTARKGKVIAHSTFYRMLSNPVYSPVFEYPVNSGNWYKATHETMITEEEYDLIQTILSSKGRPRPKKHVFTYTGLMRCGECNASVTCEEKHKKIKKDNSIKRYIYYHCTKRINPNCTQGSLEEDKLDKQIDKILEGLVIPHEFHEWALKWLKQQNKSEYEDRRKVLQVQQRQYTDCLKKLDTLIDMRAGNEITEVEYKHKRSTLMQEKARYEELLHDTEHKAEAWYNKANELLTFARDAQERFNTGDLQTKREILASLGSNSILLDKILRPNLKDELLPIETISKEVKKIHSRLETKENIDRRLQLEALYSSSPVLLRDMDSNHDRQIQSLQSYH